MKMVKKRDFDVIVEDKDGKTVKFTGKNCTVNNKSILVRLGLKKTVKETITCDKIKFD